MADTDWKRGSIAIYQGGIVTDELTVGDSYVVNQVGKSRGATYLQIVTDERNVWDLLADHFAIWHR